MKSTHAGCGVSALRIEKRCWLAAERMLLALSPQRLVFEPWLRRRNGQTRADENQNLAAIGNRDARERRAIKSTKTHWRIGPNGVDEVFEDMVSARSELRPRSFEHRDERVADELGQRSGQAISMTVATRMPATADARPLRAASFERMREKNEGDVWSDMKEPPGVKAGSLRGSYA